MNSIAASKLPSICGIEITNSISRLIAADKAEESGLSELAARLRDVRSPLLVSFDGTTCHGRRLTLPATYHKLLRSAKEIANSKKRAVNVCVAETVELYGRRWDEGTRYTYTGAGITGDGTLVVGARFPDSHGWNTLGDEEKVSLHPGTAIVQTCVFCGQDVCPTLFIHPDDARLLGLTYVSAYPEE